MRLPNPIDPVDFDERYRRDVAAWRPAMVAIAAEHGLPTAPVRAFPDGSNLVAQVGDDWIIKVFPPFHRNQWESERRVLPWLAHLPVPRLVAASERPDGYTVVVMTRLPGISLEHAWDGLGRHARRSLLRQIGALMAATHAVPVGGLAELPPAWGPFLTDQVGKCRARHERLGAPAWVVDAIDTFVPAALGALDLDADPVILTGEYTPFNLLFKDAESEPRLTGMIDFGDAMVGPAVYDLLGPAVFLAGGDAALLRALFEARGLLAWPLSAAERRGLTALLLVHRYSALDAQIRVPGWRECGSLEALADRLFGG